MNKSIVSHKNKLVYGVGINDADYILKKWYGSKRITCTYYQKWVDMLERCYSEKYQEKFPTYIGCKVCDEWLTFSKFKEWMIIQDWKNKHIDKDIIVIGNKLYSPETCCFVFEKINLLLTSSNARRGKYPQGVKIDKRSNKYQSRLSYNGTQKHLGMFNTPEEASQVYRKAKSKLITDVANEQNDERIKQGLLIHAKSYLNS